MRKSLSVAVLASVVVLGPAIDSVAADARSYRTVMTESFTVSSGTMLEIDVDDADLDLRVGDSDRIEVEVLAGGSDPDRAMDWFERMNFRAEQRDGKVVVSSDGVRNWSWGRNVWLNIRVRVQLPERSDVRLETADGDVAIETLEGEISVRTADGDVSVGNLRGGSVRLLTSDGDIQVDRIVASDLVLRTSDGDISADELDAAKIQVETSDGDISIRHASGPIELETADGDVNVAIDRFEGLEASSGDGDVTVQIDGNVGAELRIDGEDVSLRNVDGFRGKLDDDHADGSINGGGPRLRIQAGDGEIVLRAR